MIQDALQVENLFVLQVIGENQDTQMSLKWVGLDENRVRTDICRGCDTFKLNDRVKALVLMLMMDLGQEETSDSNLNVPLVLTPEQEIEKLQQEIGLLETDVKRTQDERERIRADVQSQIQKQEDEETRKREAILQELREKEEKRKQEELERKREELKKKQEEQDRINRVAELKRMKELLEQQKKEEEEKRLEEERLQREFEKRGYVPYFIRLRLLLGSVSSGETKVGSNTFQVIWKEYGIGMNQMTYKTKSSANNDYSMSNSTMDLSYTYGEDWTITGGIGFVTGGSGEITLSSSGTKYKSSGVSGNAIFGIGGMEWESYEGLIGIRYDSLKYSGFKTEGTIQSQTLNETYSIGGLIILFGIGLSF